jgi:hypothetical protein
VISKNISQLKSIFLTNEDSSLEDAPQDVKKVLQENFMQKNGIHPAVELSSLEKLFSQKIILIVNHYTGGNHMGTF